MNITLIGSHGYRAKYGGWDQLVNNLVDLSSNSISWNIVTPRENINSIPKDSMKFYHSSLSRSGFQGLLLDFYGILRNLSVTDGYLLLGAKGIPAALIAKFIFGRKIVVNVAGIEWERPQFTFLTKKYLKFCFNMSIKYSDICIIDNQHYTSYFPLIKFYNLENKYKIIPYGGEIDNSLSAFDIVDDYPFILNDYYLSVSRAIEDNKLEELCSAFATKLNGHQLVLISNFSSTRYGLSILSRYSGFINITLIDGLYNKSKLDCIRKYCRAYIHTHTLCGSAPSLIEMIVARVPIFSIDVPQNRYTLDNQGGFFKNFDDLTELIVDNHLPSLPSINLIKRYDWRNIVNSYERCFLDL